MSQSTYSLSFDGTGYVDLGHSFSWTLAQSFTLAIWCKPDALTAVQALMGKPTPYWEYYLALNQFQPDFLYYDTSGTNCLQVTGGDLRPAGAWHHIALTYDGTIGRIYLDGAEVGNQTPSRATPLQSRPAQPTVLGDAYGHTKFQGKLDDALVLNVALSPSQVAALAAGALDPTTLAPAGLWRMEEGIGTITADTSGNSYTGTLVGGVTWFSDVPSVLAGPPPHQVGKLTQYRYGLSGRRYGSFAVSSKVLLRRRRMMMGGDR